MAPSALDSNLPMEPHPMRKPKQQKKPLIDVSRSLTPLDVNQTLIAVIENASSYCAPSYVIRTPGLFGFLPSDLTRAISESILASLAFEVVGNLTWR
jgi:hypothetical protein